MNRKSTVAWACLVGTCVAILALGWTHRAAFRSPVATPTMRFHPPAGARYEFELHFDSKGQARAAAFGQASQGLGGMLPYGWGMDARLAWTSLGPSNQEGSPSTVLALSMRDVHIRTEGATSGFGTAAPALEAAQVFALVSADGRIQSLEASSSLDTVPRNVIRAVLSYVETILPEGQAVEWTASQSSLEGPVQATYTVQAMDRNAARLRRTEQLRETQGAYHGNNGGEKHLEGSCDLRVETAAGVADTIDCQRKERRLLGGLLVSEQSSQFAVKRVGYEQVTEDALRELLASRHRGQSVAFGLSAKEDRQAKARQEALTLAGASPLESLLHGLEKGETNPKLGAILDAHLLVTDHAAQKLGGLLRGLRSEDRNFHAVASALARQDGGAGQRALLSALDAPNQDLRTRRLVVAHAGMAKRPSAETVQTLQKLAEEGKGELRKVAELALGNAASQRRQDDPAQADELVRILGARLAEAKDARERIHLLRALGNAGGDDVFDLVTPYLQDDQEEVREAAVAALRAVSDPRAQEACKHATQHDPSALVRASAIKALPESTQGAADVVAVLTWVFANERDEVVVRSALEKAAALASRVQGAKQLLAEYRRTCGLPALCRTASMLLSSIEG